MKKVLVPVLVLAAAAVAYYALGTGRSSQQIHYRMVTVEQGDLEAVVAATGTLDPVTTVQVGTQVSGIINEIFVDFNDPVTAGQVIAHIDTTLLASAVAAARAQLARSRAELRHADREYERITALHEGDMVSDSELSTAQYSLDIAHASVQSAEVDLARAQQNLSYATITSPIAGTVISRSVDVGQTVQSSFSAPELFRIAGDLTRMQILVSVDESDVGRISEGQQVRFTVQAYPDDTFTGTVDQMRLQSVIEDNVVNYTAVVDVANPDGRLLPGMTATVDFIVETAGDVLYVPNAALRYRPDQETMAAAFERRRALREAAADGGEGQERPERNGRPGMAGGQGQPGATDRGMLWTVNDSGQLEVVPVRTGISDGTHTAVTGRDLTADLQVIAGVSATAAATGTGSPFQQDQNNRRRGPPTPGGF